MVVVNKPEEYDFIRFQKSNTENKKYDAILKHKTTGRTKTVPFGDRRFQHFKDTTGLALYNHLNHLDKERRRLFRLRFKKSSSKKFSSSYFSYNYLW